jgi:hypothetical protein
VAFLRITVMKDRMQSLIMRLVQTSHLGADMHMSWCSSKSLQARSISTFL